MQAADVGGVQAMNKEPLLCSALAEQRVPQANNMLQCSLVCSSCLSIQVKWTAAASFAHNNMKQLENIFEKSRAISLCKSRICTHFFLYHTIFTRFGSVKTHFFHSLLNSVCIFFFVVFKLPSRKDFFILSEEALWCGILGNSIEKGNSTVCTRQSGGKENFILATSKLLCNHHATAEDLKSSFSYFSFLYDSRILK